GNWVAVGAPNSNPTEDFPTYYQGAVYLYRRDGSGNWTYAKEIEIGSPTSADRAGAAVALSGDRLAVGLPGRGRSTRYGAVQVFERNTGGADQWGIEASF